MPKNCKSKLTLSRIWSRRLDLFSFAEKIKLLLLGQDEEQRTKVIAKVFSTRAYKFFYEQYFFSLHNITLYSTNFLILLYLKPQQLNCTTFTHAIDQHSTRPWSTEAYCQHIANSPTPLHTPLPLPHTTVHCGTAQGPRPRHYTPKVQKRLQLFSTHKQCIGRD